MRLLEDTAKEQGVDVQAASDLPDVEVSAAIELVLANILGNAIKYADPAKQRRWVEIRGRIEPAEREGNAKVIVEVQDNGVGVPAEDRQRIFERFYRSPATAGGVEGSGIGLTIVQDVMSSIGGRAWAEFPDAGGSVFAIALPFRAGED
jgi:signal transduction histidine kinase